MTRSIKNKLILFQMLFPLTTTTALYFGVQSWLKTAEKRLISEKLEDLSQYKASLIEKDLNTLAYHSKLITIASLEYSQKPEKQVGHFEKLAGSLHHFEGMKVNAFPKSGSHQRPLHITLEVGHESPTPFNLHPSHFPPSNQIALERKGSKTILILNETASSPGYENIEIQTRWNASELFDKKPKDETQILALNSDGAVFFSDPSALYAFSENLSHMLPFQEAIIDKKPTFTLFQDLPGAVPKLSFVTPFYKNRAFLFANLPLTSLEKRLFQLNRISLPLAGVFFLVQLLGILFVSWIVRKSSETPAT